MLIQLSNVVSTVANFSPVNIKISTGDILHVEGPQGIGKTTLLKIICGITKKYHGSIIVDHHNADKKTGKIVSNAIFGNGLYQHLSVHDNLKRWSGFDLTDAALHFFQLTNYKERIVSDLTLEIQRKVALSRLLICHNKLWIIDEADIYLDQIFITTLAGLFYNHAYNHKGMIVFTGNNQAIAEIANQKLPLFY